MLYGYSHACCMRACCTTQGVTTAIALTQGLGSPMFAICVAFSVIVMYDAMGVRRHAGKQAEVLNQVRSSRAVKVWT